VYVVGSDIDGIVCAGFERKGTSGNAYLDMEFNQNFQSKAGCSYIGTAQEWRCLYPVRVINDSQVSFALSGSSFELWVYRWDGANWAQIVYAQGSGSIASGAIKAAINLVPVTAGGWKYVNQQSTEQTTIDAQAFFEACIDFTGIGFGEFCASSVIIKSRSSSSINANVEDTTGVIEFAMCLTALTFPPTPSPVLPTPPTTPIPSRPPTTPIPSRPPTTPLPTLPTPQPTRNPTRSPTLPSPTTTATTTSNPTAVSSPTAFQSTPNPSDDRTITTTAANLITTNGGSGSGSGEGAQNSNDGGNALMIGIIVAVAVLVLIAIGVGVWYYKKKRSNDFYI
jgi:hypothetical protein